MTGIWLHINVILDQTDASKYVYALCHMNLFSNYGTIFICLFLALLDRKLDT